jgi:hypothetical protein
MTQYPFHIEQNVPVPEGVGLVDTWTAFSGCQTEADANKRYKALTHQFPNSSFRIVKTIVIKESP